MAINKVNYDDKVDLQIWASIPNANKVKAQDMNELKKVINENADELINVQESQEDQDEFLQDIYNVLPTETQEGENLNIQGTANIKFKEFVVGGNSKQETREGYNLLNVENELTIKGNIDKEVNMPPGEYTIKFEEAETDGATQYLFQFIKDSTNLTYERIAITANKRTFTLNDTANKVSIYSGTGYDESTNVTTTYKNLMIYAGTDDKPYEAYGASPSPDFKSDIENVEGNVNITDCNKNIMPINTSNYFEYTERGIKRNSNNYDGATVATFKIKKGQKLKIGLLLFSKPTTNTSFSFYEDGASNSSYAFGNINNNKLNQIYEKEYTATEDVELSYRLWGNSNNETFEFQLWAELDELTDYEQHEEQVVTFPLSEGQKLYKGDYLASDGIHHKGTQIELDEEDTSWRLGQYAVEGTTQFTMDKPSNISSLRFCSHFANKEQTLNGMYLGSALSFYPAINTGLTSLELWKSYLTQQKTAGTPVILEYDLAEEEVETYTEAQQEAYNQLLKLKSYDGSTNIYSTNETSPIFKVTAVKDINSVITQLNTVLLERS